MVVAACTLGIGSDISMWWDSTGKSQCGVFGVSSTRNTAFGLRREGTSSKPRGTCLQRPKSPSLVSDSVLMQMRTPSPHSSLRPNALSGTGRGASVLSVEVGLQETCRRAGSGAGIGRQLPAGSSDVGLIEAPVQTWLQGWFFFIII